MRTVCIVGLGSSFFIWPRPWIEKSEDELEKKLVFLLFSLFGWMDGYSCGNINEKNVLSFSTCFVAAAQHMPYHQVACVSKRPVGKKRRTRKEKWNLFLLIKLDWFFHLATFFLFWKDALSMFFQGHLDGWKNTKLQIYNFKYRIFKGSRILD